MKKYIADKYGKTHIIDFFEIIENEKTGYYIDNIYHKTKVYFRPEKTWNDHMGNTPCGHYIIAHLPTGEKKRVYIY